MLIHGAAHGRLDLQISHPIANLSMKGEESATAWRGRAAGAARAWDQLLFDGFVDLGFFYGAWQPREDDHPVLLFLRHCLHRPRASAQQLGGGPC
jgi:hypothetical protein